MHNYISIDTLTALYCRKGSFFCGSEDFSRVQIYFDLASGQWIAAWRGNQLMGWLSYYLLSTDDMRFMKDEGFMAAVKKNYYFNIRGGNYIYVSIAMIADGAPKWLLSNLLRTLYQRFPNANWICTHLNNRGQNRFSLRKIRR